MPLRLVVQWPRLGSYYLARLRVVHTMLRAHDVELIALETASTDALYAWKVEEGATPYRRVQTFPGQNFHEIAPRVMEDETMRMLDALNPDIVAIHSYGFPDARACLVWCRRNRRVAVGMFDSKANDAPRVGWRESLKRHILSAYDASLGAGTSTRAYLRSLGVSDASIFDGYDVVDNDYFAAAARQAQSTPALGRDLPGLQESGPFFLAVGRYLSIKNYDGLLRAYAAYRRISAAPWRLVIVGDGEERAALDQVIASESIDGVTLAGFQQIEALGVYYGRASAFVHPAHKDTWGLVVNEAMAAGLPVIVSAESGCAPDLVREGENGYVVPSNDLNLLTQRLSSLAASEAKLTSMGTKSREIVAEWPLERFATGLWDAAQYGLARPRRGSSLAVESLFAVLRYGTRHVSALHTTVS